MKLISVATKILLLAVMIIFSCRFGHSQCTVNALNSGSAIGKVSKVSLTDPFWQSFIPCQTGEITSISFRLASSSLAGTNELYIVSNIVPLPPLIQTFTNAGGAETITINLTTPFPVNSGTSYFFGLLQGVQLDLQVRDPNSYLDGTLVGNSADLNFELQIGPSSVVATPVPTVGQWGLIILGIILISISVVTIQSKERAS